MTSYNAIINWDLSAVELAVGTYMHAWGDHFVRYWCPSTYKYPQFGIEIDGESLAACLVPIRYTSSSLAVYNLEVGMDQDTGYQVKHLLYCGSPKLKHIADRHYRQQKQNQSNRAPLIVIPSIRNTIITE